jgi:hypothetical protein
MPIEACVAFAPYLDHPRQLPLPTDRPVLCRFLLANILRLKLGTALVKEPLESASSRR